MLRKIWNLFLLPEYMNIPMSQTDMCEISGSWRKLVSKRGPKIRLNEAIDGTEFFYCRESPPKTRPKVGWLLYE